MSEQFERFSAAHAVGDVVEGRVSKVLPFGAFVRVGEVDGFLQATPPPADGAPVRARVVAIDAERERFALEAV
jgi:S1 RNA binding domain